MPRTPTLLPDFRISDHNLYTFLILHGCYMFCPSTAFDLITLVIIGKEHKLLINYYFQLNLSIAVIKVGKMNKELICAC